MKDFPKYDDFKDCLVAFIDILGFDKKVRSIDCESKFSEISILLDTLQKTAKNFSKNNNIFYEYEFTAISDSIIITVPFNNPICTIGMLIILHNLQYELLATNFKTLLRGYITRGNVYHKNNLLFGEGYSKAYRGESKIQGAPRIVLDPKVVKDAKSVIETTQNIEKHISVLEYLIEDQDDNFYFIDYLKPIGFQAKLTKQQLTEERESIKNFIYYSLKQYENEHNIKSKYQWLENYFNNTDKYFK